MSVKKDDCSLKRKLSAGTQQERTSDVTITHNRPENVTSQQSWYYCGFHVVMVVASLLNLSEMSTSCGLLLVVENFCLFS